MIFRLLDIVLISVFAIRAKAYEETKISLRVLPTDLDLNLHLTNSRYFKFMDLSRYNHIIKTGVWKLIKSKKIRPVVGGAAIQFRRSLPLFTKVNITTKILSYDKKWIYLAHSIASKDKTYSKAILRTTFINHNGKIAMDEVFNQLEQSFVAPYSNKPIRTSDLNTAFNSIDFDQP